jgi:hypothetical protein
VYQAVRSRTSESQKIGITTQELQKLGLVTKDVIIEVPGYKQQDWQAQCIRRASCTSQQAKNALSQDGEGIFVWAKRNATAEDSRRRNGMSDDELQAAQLGAGRKESRM